jgi:hypothetical protein
VIGGSVGNGAADVCYQPLLTGDHLMILAVICIFVVSLLGFYAVMLKIGWRR